MEDRYCKCGNRITGTKEDKCYACWSNEEPINLAKTEAASLIDDVREEIEKAHNTN